MDVQARVVNSEAVAQAISRDLSRRLLAACDGVRERIVEEVKAKLSRPIPPRSHFQSGDAPGMDTGELHAGVDGNTVPTQSGVKVTVWSDRPSTPEVPVILESRGLPYISTEFDELRQGGRIVAMLLEELQKV